jgi:hypothetical protein
VTGEYQRFPTPCGPSTDQHLILTRDEVRVMADEHVVGRDVLDVSVDAAPVGLGERMRPGQDGLDVGGVEVMGAAVGVADPVAGDGHGQQSS